MGCKIGKCSRQGCGLSFECTTQEPTGGWEAGASVSIPEGERRETHSGNCGSSTKGPFTEAWRQGYRSQRGDMRLLGKVPTSRPGGTRAGNGVG